MPIQSGDIKLLASAVMADVPEGGGPPTGNVIPDGVSNSIFPDISEVARAGGRVNLRKVHLAVWTDDVDTFLDANIIVARPFADPRVTATLFSTKSVFDTRIQAQSRIESYLNKGAEWAGFLYENHIAGQRAIQLFQRVGSELPRVGQTLVLVQNEGLGTEKEQYVRVTKVSQVERTFTYNVDQDYKAWVLTLDISDALRSDFTGTSANRQFQRGASATKTRDTLVADAGSYYGASALTQAASIGDFSVQAASIYTQLVPSAQTETPLADVSLIQTTKGYNISGGVIVQTLTQIFTTTTSLYVGGAILPGSLSVARGGITLTDKGERLYNGGTEVGLIDYDNGVLTLLTNVFGTGSGAHVVTYTPAVAARMIGGSVGEYVTAENRSLSKVFTLPDIPAPYSLAISYQVGGRWYVLREDGSGAIRGQDASYGAGTLNRTTGTTSVTFGALPDVGSAVIYQWLPGGVFGQMPASILVGGGKVFHEIVLEHQSAHDVTVAWNDGAARSATVNSVGVIGGHASGFRLGTSLYLSPNSVPAKGTAFTVDYKHTVTSESAADMVGTHVLTDEGARWRLTVPGLGGDLYAGGLWITLARPTHLIDGTQSGENFSSLYLSCAGGQVKLGAWYSLDPEYTTPQVVGTVGSDYIEFDKTITRRVDVMKIEHVAFGDGGVMTRTTYGFEPVTVQTAPGGVLTVTQGSLQAGTVSSTEDHSMVYTSDALRLRANTGGNDLAAIRFKLGNQVHASSLTDDLLYRGVSPATAVGTVLPAQGVIDITEWAAGISPTVTEWSAALVPPIGGSASPYTAANVIFRTATAPLRPSSMTISGETVDGVAFTVTADAAGKFNHARLKGRINVESGVAEVYATYPGAPGGVTPPNDYAWAAGKGPAVDLSHLGIAGVGLVFSSLIKTASLKYNAVAYTYLPLDAELLGIDPVRLPTDGRVPIFRPGGYAVVGHTGQINITVSTGQTVDCGRVRLSRVRVVGADGAVIHTGYTADLEDGTVSFTDVSGYSQPIKIQHRVEDMAVVSDAQISGLITFTRRLTHDYPVGSYVSSALMAGDLFARVSHVFDQQSWTVGQWADALVGNDAAASFNHTAFPITVTNRGALTERWVVRFTTGPTAFQLIGEHVGVIAEGNTATDFSPINPTTGAPYFTIPALGWGSGWAAGNVLRINTIAAGANAWTVRTVQQGPETVADDSWELLGRGDVDTLAD